MQHHGIERASASEAQKQALASGRAKHPTAGKERDEATKTKIALNLHKSWKEQTPEVIEKKREAARQRWNNIPESEQVDMRKKAQKALLKAAKEGSQFEKLLAEKLEQAGFKVEQNREFLLSKSKMRVDIFLPELGMAIEVDGPTHLFAIHGEEALLKVMQSDAEKNYLLAEAGFICVRLANYFADFSKLICSDYIDKLIPVIKDLGQATELDQRIYHLSIGNPSRQISKNWGLKLTKAEFELAAAKRGIK
jgi:very-short-patch-repair endonuclease